MKTVQTLTSLFQESLNADSLHHAWVIEGLSLEAADSWLLSTLSTLLGKTVAADHFHPNLKWLNNEDTHTVLSVRELISFLEKTSWDGHYKVGVIMGADHMNVQAQNALLKMMEEPPSKTVLFLMSEQSNSLLPTIYSRGFHVVMQSELELDAAFEQFKTQWISAFFTYLDTGKLEQLFEVQTYLNDEDVPAKTQGKWVMLAFKQLLDSTYTILESKNTTLHNLKNYTHKNWLDQWSKAAKYQQDAEAFKVDLKAFCTKLTIKLVS